jgi:ubiquinone/menaquinone biosynthesis C-methylase UbiE
MLGIDFLNTRTMKSREAIGFYSRLKELYPYEEVALSSISDEIRGQPILDLGVGGGRTVQALRNISEDYLGLDYTEDMVSSCRENYPEAEFVHADARDLSRYEDGSFALIVFSSEGLCMVGHEDRLKILTEIQRLLRPDGIAMFSTYNKDSASHDARFQCHRFLPTKNPARFVVRLCRCLVQNAMSYMNRLRFKKHEVRLPRYSIINDVYHYYSTLLYYISIDHQIEQLRSCNFQGAIDIVDSNGFLESREFADKVLCFLARK